jgi:hypothetical protein
VRAVDDLRLIGVGAARDEQPDPRSLSACHEPRSVGLA